MAVIKSGASTDQWSIDAISKAGRVTLYDLAGNPIELSLDRNSNYWDVQDVPATNTKATVTKASAGVGIRNVCTGFTVTLAAGASAPAAINLTVMVVDGATTGTTYLWRTTISIPATAGAVSAFVRSNIWLRGTADTAMTIEFSAAGGANTFESVTMEGTTIPE